MHKFTMHFFYFPCYQKKVNYAYYSNTIILILNYCLVGIDQSHLMNTPDDQIQNSLISNCN